jgi:hypothetical protein
MKTATEKKPEKKADKSAAMEGYIAEIDRFAGMLRKTQESIKDLEKEVAVAKQVYDDAKESLREAERIEHSTVSLLLKFIRPGSIDVMPLFDTMEEADEETMGVNADEWRKEPVVVLDLSSAALRALIDADIVLVGQLQDRILKGEEWAADLVGVNDGMAQAIEAKLQQFIDEKTKRKKK